MFIEAADIDAGEVVWLFCGTSNTDADYQAYLDSIDRLIKAAPHTVRPAGIQVVAPDSPAPNAQWRKRIADHTRRFPRDDAMYCMVTRSTAIRGVLTAINWMRRPNYAFAVRPSFDEAVAWVEQQRGHAASSLPRLYAQAQAQATDALAGAS